MDIDSAAPVNVKKKHGNKIKEILIRILDDGTFLVEYRCQDYEKNKTYSYKNSKDLIMGLKKDYFDPNEEKSKNDYDELSRPIEKGKK